MTDIVTGPTPQTIISGQRDYAHGGEVGAGLYPFLLMQRMEAGHADLVRDVTREGAANSLAVEKIGAATLVAVEKIAAAQALAAAENTAKVQADIARCCCEVKELIREVQATAVRDSLAAANAELLAIKYSRGNGNGN